MKDRVSVSIEVGDGSAGRDAPSADASPGTAADARAAAIATRYEDACAKLRFISGSGQLAAGELNSVLTRLAAFSAQARQDSPDVSQGLALLNSVSEDFPWAYAEFSDFARFAWPALPAPAQDGAASGTSASPRVSVQIQLGKSI